MKRRANSSAHWLILALLAPAWLAGCSPTATYGTGEAPEVALVREVAGGIIGGKKKPIDYQPRAPLVMPPSGDQLPPPAESVATASPDWPVDPNERLASTRPEEKDVRAGGSQAEYRRLKPLIGVLPTGGLAEKEASPYDIVRSKSQRQQFQKALAESKGFARTERQYLTDPPDAYRKPAASAPTEFEGVNGDGEGGGGGWWRWLFGHRG